MGLKLTQPPFGVKAELGNKFKLPLANADHHCVQAFPIIEMPIKDEINQTKYLEENWKKSDFRQIGQDCSVRRTFDSDLHGGMKSWSFLRKHFHLFHKYRLIEPNSATEVCPNFA